MDCMMDLTALEIRINKLSLACRLQCFSMFENCIEEEFGDDDLFKTTDHDHFLLKLLARKQLARLYYLLTAESILRILLRMCSGIMSY